MQYITHTEKETRDLAKKIAGQLRGKGAVLALVGSLGAGKTTFVQGFAQGLGIKDKILSPTFVLIKQHKIPDSGSTLFHIDLYRLDTEKDLNSLGVDELWSKPDNIVLIEWGEKAKAFLPKNTTWISFNIAKENQREITLSNLF